MVMKSSQSLCKQQIARLILDAGATSVGFAKAKPVDDIAAKQFSNWIKAGYHANMQYLNRYHDQRNNPQLLLDGTRTVISAAFNYYSPDIDSPLQWAKYALGDDYHDIIRKRLSLVADTIAATTGAQCRVCVDTAPIRERYWATRAGIGFIGRNNQLIIPGAGSYFFLGEILTTLDIQPDKPLSATNCGNCRRCIDACPGKALNGHGQMDARRCISYLTIEHRGELPAHTHLGDRIYGCDECQRVCPHNQLAVPTTLPELTPRVEITCLTANDILSMRPERFSAIFRNSAIKRTKLTGLQRNAALITSQQLPSTVK